MILGGGVNLTREPRSGRTFEYMGEDPLLAGTLDGNVMRGEQDQHVIGDIKHYAVNDQESGRYAVNANTAGESRQATVHIDPKLLKVYDEQTDSWKLIPGTPSRREARRGIFRSKKRCRFGNVLQRLPARRS